MKPNLWKTIFVLAGYLLVTGSVVHADTLDVSLTQATLSVVQGTTLVAFDAVVSNPSSSVETIYLNGDSTTTSSSLVSVDDAPFFANSPFFLDVGTASGPFEIFDVLLDPSLGPGVYTGTFSILGGGDGGIFDDVGDANFTIEITAPVATPEPTTLLMLGTGLLSLACLRRYGASTRARRAA
jgi:hypothetical protein